MKLIALSALLILVLATAPAAAPEPDRASCGPTLVTVSEAEILIYVMPLSVEIRQRGRDVAWGLTTSPAWDQADYYVFRVVFTGATAGSQLVGNYAVNKHTADLMDISAEYRLLTSRQLEGVQKILRREHCIGRATILKYRYVNPAAGGTRLTPEDLPLPRGAH